MSSHELDPETVAAIKRDAALAICARLSENGENVAALRVLQEARKLYGDPPPPKRVRAEVGFEAGTSQLKRVRWEKNGGTVYVRILTSYQGAILAREELQQLAALDARADADGMVEEESGAATCSDRNGVVSAEPEAAPASTAAIGTWERPITSDQVYAIIRRYHLLSCVDPIDEHASRRMMAALEAIGLKVVL